jgi:hypothetical protein
MLRSPSVSALSSKMYLLTWTKPYEADFYHQLYKTGLKKIKKPFTSAGEYSYYQIAGLEIGGGGAYLIAADQNHLDVSRFSAKGKQIGANETKKLSVYFGSSFDCVLLPDGKCLFVTSRNLDAGQEDYEVYGFTLDLE